MNLCSFLILFLLNNNIKTHHYDIEELGKTEVIEYLDINQYLLINTTKPFLSIIFGTDTPLSVRVFKENSSTLLLDLVESFNVPSDRAGYDFGDNAGSAEIKPIIPGSVTLMAMLFPDNCRTRYISNLDEDSFYFGTQFLYYKTAQNNAICIWHTNPNYSLITTHEYNPSPKTSLKACTSNENCVNAAYGSTASLSNSHFLLFTPESYDMLDQTKLSFISEKSGHLFKHSSVFNTSDPRPIPISFLFKQDAIRPQSRAAPKPTQSSADNALFVSLFALFSFTVLLIFALVCFRRLSKDNSSKQEERVPLLPADVMTNGIPLPQGPVQYGYPQFVPYYQPIYFSHVS